MPAIEAKAGLQQLTTSTWHYQCHLRKDSLPLPARVPKEKLSVAIQSPMARSH
jgi:hypothetical protein